MSSKVQKKAMHVAVDDGYAFTKVAYYDDNFTLHTHHIPSIFGNADLGEFEMDFEGRPVNTYRTAEHDGDKALSGRYCIHANLTDHGDTLTGHYPTSAANRCVIHHALLSAGLDPSACDTLNLGVTLPIRDYFSSDRESLIKKRQQSLAKPVFKEHGLSDQIPMFETGSVLVVPEAIMAYIDFYLDDQGDQRIDESDVVAVVDVGGHTTDIAVVKPGLSISSKHAASVELGINDYMKRVQDLVFVTHKVKVSVRQINKALVNNGAVNIQGKKEDLSRYLNQASEIIARELRAHVSRVIGNDAEVDCVLYVGGGAKVLGQALSQHPNVVIPEDPHLANARGLLKFMTFVKE